MDATSLGRARRCDAQRALVGALLLWTCACGDSTTPEPRVQSIRVTSDAATVRIGLTRTFTATALDESGNAVAGRTLVWSTSDSTIARVDQNGVVTGLKLGDVSVQARLDDVVGQTPLRVEDSPFLAPFRAFNRDTLTVVPLAATRGVDVQRLAGLVLELDDAAERVTVKLIDRARNVVAGPFRLQPDPARMSHLQATSVSLLGLSDLRLDAWVSSRPGGPREVGLSFSRGSPRSAALASAQATPAVPVRAPEDRLGYLELWRTLGEGPPITALDRWSQLVQHIVNVNLQRNTNYDLFVSAVTADLVDVFVADDDYRLILDGLGQHVVPLNRVIADPQLTGFAPIFQAGDGRFRHFSANARCALIDQSPGDVATILVGGVLGGDLQIPLFSDPPSADTQADLATNAIGRSFVDELDRLWDRRADGETTNHIGDGQSVRLWILDQFGPPIASVSILPDPIPELPFGQSTQLTGVVLGTDGQTLTGHGLVWSSSDPSVLTVSQAGLVQRVAPGTATVKVETRGGKSTTKNVTVRGSLEVTGPPSISFRHVMGVTPCLQQIATYQIRNVSQKPVQWSAVEQDYGGFTRLDAQPRVGTLAPGESVTINVVFLCNTDRSFTSVFDISGTTGVAREFFRLSIPVTAEIDRTAGTLTVTTATVGEGVPDGYSVVDVEFGTTIGTIGISETKTFQNVRPGTYLIRLVPTPSAANCTAQGGFLRDVTVPAGGNTSASFSMTCASTGPLVSVTPGELTDQHMVGLTQCPDPVGTLHVTNLRSVPVTVTLRWSGTNEISLSSTQVVIPPSANADVTATFTCATQSSFQGTISLSAQSSGGSQTVNVPVSVSVLHRGVVLDHTLSQQFTVGMFIRLTRITGGGIGNVEAGCSGVHFHGGQAGIRIDGQGPFPDPNPTGCGYGLVVYRE